MAGKFQNFANFVSDNELENIAQPKIFTQNFGGSNPNPESRFKNLFLPKTLITYKITNVQNEV